MTLEQVKASHFFVKKQAGHTGGTKARELLPFIGSISFFTIPI